MGACAKIRYRDRVAALLALSRTGQHGERRPKEERRAYYCQQCRGWHLTSHG